MTGGAVDLAPPTATRPAARPPDDGSADGPGPARAGGSAGGDGVVGAVVDGRAFVQTASARGLGPALRWAVANGAQRLTVIAEAPVAADLARRAALLEFDIDVWSAEGPDVQPAAAVAATDPPTPPADHLPFAGLIAEAGARPVDDHGTLVAEVAGLEVARVVDDGGPRLAVGVGQADRELQGYVHGHLDDDANLRRAIAAVARHRRPGAGSHPLSRVARQRWLRSVLLDEPALLDLPVLEPVSPLRPRVTVLGDEPAAAAGPGVVVVCSVGVDLDLLPEAADYRQRVEPGAELVVVVPQRDRRLATATVGPVVPDLRVESIDTPWEW